MNQNLTTRAFATIPIVKFVITGRGMKYHKEFVRFFN